MDKVFPYVSNGDVCSILNDSEYVLERAMTARNNKHKGGSEMATYIHIPVLVLAMNACIRSQMTYS